MRDYREGTAALLDVFDRLPASVKQAGVPELLGHDRPGTDFADPYSQKYPYHTAAATVASLVRLEFEPDGIKKAALRGKLLKRAALFGVQPPEEAVVKQASYFEESAVESDDPLPVNVDEATAAVKQAAEYHDRFTLVELSKLAGRVLASFPDAIPADLKPTVEKWAGVGAFDRQGMADALAKRAQLHLAVGRPDEALAMAEAGEAVLEYLPSAQLAKVAQMVDAVDRDTGLYGMAGVAPAREFCRHPLSTIESTVEDLVETKMGTVFSRAALADADTVKIAAVFGEDYYRNLCDAGLFFSVDKAVAAVESADGVESTLWARVVSPEA